MLDAVTDIRHRLKWRMAGRELSAGHRTLVCLTEMHYHFGHLPQVRETAMYLRDVYFNRSRPALDDWKAMMERRYNGGPYEH